MNTLDVVMEYVLSIAAQLEITHATYLHFIADIPAFVNLDISD